MNPCVFDGNCEFGYICTKGKCTLLTPCYSDDDCRSGFECNTPYCTLRANTKPESSQISSTSGLPVNAKHVPNLISSSSDVVYVNPCGCYKSITRDRSYSNTQKTNVVPGNSNQDGSFCSMVRNYFNILAHNLP